MPAPVGERSLLFLFWLPSNRLLPQCSRSAQDIMVTKTGKVPATRFEYCRMFWGCSVAQLKPSLSIWRLSSQDTLAMGQGEGWSWKGEMCGSVLEFHPLSRLTTSSSAWPLSGGSSKPSSPGPRSRQNSWWGHGCFGALSHLLPWASDCRPAKQYLHQAKAWPWQDQLLHH